MAGFRETKRHFCVEFVEFVTEELGELDGCVASDDLKYQTWLVYC